MSIRTVPLNDGTNRVGYIADEPDAHVVLTGPIQGGVTTSDGTTYDVTPGAILVASPEHAAEVMAQIGDRHMLEGHPAHDPDTPFVHVPPADMDHIDGPTAGMSPALAAAMLDAGNGINPTVNYYAQVNLATGATGTTGANAMTGATAQACAWNAASTTLNTKTNSSSLSYSNPGTAMATDFICQSTGALFGIGGPLTAGVQAATINIAAGALTIGATSPSR